jgi:glycerol-3-phosphate dehydrogenase
MDKKIRKIINGHPAWASLDLSFSISNDGIVTLAGQVDAWDQVVEIGHKVAELKDVRNVVNHLTVTGMESKVTDRRSDIDAAKALGTAGACDCVIIGAGITGCAIARALSKYELKVMVVDKNNDVAEGTTKANNGNIHPGVQAKPGTLKADLNLLGNAMYDQWAEELNFSFKRTGSLEVIYDKKEWRFMNLVKLMKKTGIGHLIPAMGQVMKTPGLEWLSTEELLALEPYLTGQPLGGLLMKTMGLVEPYEVCIALAENAAENGTKFMLETEILDLLMEDEKIAGVVTSAGIIQCGMVINAAGVFADEIAAMGDDEFFTIHPRRGAIAILDKSKGHLLSRPAGVRGNKDAKAKNTKGGGASVTPEGNLLWGPTAQEVADKEDRAVKAEDLPYILSLGTKVLDGVDASDIITSFAGLRAADYKEDFIIEASRKTKGLIHAAAIQSPGLASAPAIAELVEGLVIDHYGKVEKKADYNPIRKAPIKFRDLSRQEQAALIDRDPRYGRIICRCEMVTEGEILDAIHSPIPARTLDAVKRRTRAGMGRCQSGFCGPRVVEILAREWHVSPIEITKKGKGSKVLLRDSRP